MRPGDAANWPLRRYGGAVWGLNGGVRKLHKCHVCRKGLPKKTRCWFPIVENGHARLTRGCRICQTCMKRIGHV
jgi:hypothetical protein